MTNSRLVYSLGTSTRSAEDFLKLLKDYQIELVIDVRRFPTSRFQHFQQSHLVSQLREAGIKYLYLGDKLGGYRSGGYRAFLNTEDFAQGIQELETQLHGAKAVILCAERLPWRCHRRFITAELERRSWQVKHIINEKRVWGPASPGNQLF